MSTSTTKELVGVDVFLHWDEQGRDADVLGERLSSLAGHDFKLKMITNRGVKVWPEGLPQTFRTDHWRVRFVLDHDLNGSGRNAIIRLLQRVTEAGFDAVKTENLYRFDGAPGYSMGQGE